MDFYYCGISIVSLFGLYCVYKFKPHEAIVNSYTKYERAIHFLNKTNSLTFLNKIYIISSFVKFFFNIFYVSFIQYMYSNLKFNSINNTYELEYTIGNSNYVLIVNSKKKCDILQITNDEDIDITDEILPYIGPSLDWHGKMISPSYFNLNSITFELSNGKSITYNKNSFMTILLEI